MPYNAIKPEAGAFGQAQGAYLAKLQGRSGDPTADALNQIALMVQARQGGGDYMQALREANQFQERGAMAENNKDVTTSYLTAAPGLIKEGAGSAIQLPADNPYIRTDPRKLVGSDAIHQQDMQSGIVKNVGEGVKNLSEAGMAPPASEVGGMITPYLQTTPTPVEAGYITPKVAVDQKNAESNRIKAEADMYDAKHGGQGRGGSKEKTVTTFMSDGKGGFVPISMATTSAGGVNPGAGTHVTPVKKKFAFGKDGKVHPVTE